MAVINNQALIGSILPAVHYKNIILESGGDINPIVGDDPHILDMSIWDEQYFYQHAATNTEQELIGSPPPQKTWDTNQTIDPDSAKMTATVNLTLKDIYDPKDDNASWMFNEFFLNHVYLVVVCMAGNSDHSVGGTDISWSGEYAKWKIFYHKTGVNIYDAMATGNWVFPGWAAEQDLGEDAVYFGATSDITNYIIKKIALKDVIKTGIPQYAEIFNSSGETHNPTEDPSIANPDVQKKIIHSLLNDPASIADSQVKIDDLSAGAKIINIPFQVPPFEIEHEKSTGLAFFAYTYFDHQAAPMLMAEAGEGDYPDIVFPDLPAGSPGSTILRSPGNVKCAIKDGKLNKTDEMFMLPSGLQWHGRVQKIDPHTKALLQNYGTDSQIKENPYLIGGGGTSAWYTQKEIQPGWTPNDEKLTPVKKKENIISDFRALTAIEKVILETKNYQNNIASTKLIESSENIILPDRPDFGDAWLNLSDVTGPKELDFTAASFLFNIDIANILRKESSFPWIYSVPSSPVSDAATIKFWAREILSHAKDSTVITNFRVKRRAVERHSRLTTKSIKDIWIPRLGEDPDPHTDGIDIIENSEVQSLKGSTTHEKISPLISVEGIPEKFIGVHSEVQSPNRFHMRTDWPMEAAWDEKDGVSWAGRFSKLTNLYPLFSHHDGIGAEAGYPGILSISGTDLRIPKTGKARYQYGVEFDLKDGFTSTLKAILGDPGDPINDPDTPDIPLLSLHHCYSFMTEIKKHIDLDFIGTTGGGKMNVANAITGEFTPEYIQYVQSLSPNPATKIFDTLKTYFSLLMVFSVETEYDWQAEGKVYKISYGIKNLDSLLGDGAMDNINSSINPILGGSAIAFLQFYEMLEDMIYMIRRLVGSPTSKSLLMGTDPNIDGKAEFDNLTYESPTYIGKSVPGVIKKEHWFPQTVKSPSQGTTGYCYNAHPPGGQFETYQLDFFDKWNYNISQAGARHVNNQDWYGDLYKEAKRYFTDLDHVAPDYQTKEGISFNFGAPNESLREYKTINGVYLNDNYFSTSMTPGTPDADGKPTMLKPEVPLASMLLKILARAELDKGTYPSEFTHPNPIYDGSWSKEDQVLSQKIMLNRSCIINPQIGFGTLLGDEEESEEFINLFMTDHDTVPADDLDIDSPGGGPAGVSWASHMYGSENLSFFANLLYELVVHDEFNFFAALDLSKYLIHANATAMGTDKYTNSGAPIEASYIQQLINKYAPNIVQGTPQHVQQTLLNIVKALPIPVKYLFTVINQILNVQSSDIAGDAVAIANFIQGIQLAGKINTWFLAEVLSAIYWPTISATPILNDSVVPNIKEAIGELWFNFFNIGKVEVFAGFKIMADGHPSIKHPVWAPPPTLEQLINYDAKEASVKFGQAKVLARITSWDGGDLLKLNKRWSTMPILGKYFYIQVL